MIRDRSSAARACDHYVRYAADLADLRGLSNTAHRFSIEWSRVEPQEGQFSQGALEHYADVARTCQALGMEPIVTLHHFTLPLWLADRGGLLCPEAPRLFARYAAVCADVVGPYVQWWITLNEPAVLAVFAYLRGEWPPARRSLPETIAAATAALRMHAAGTRAVRRVARRHGRKALISISHHERRLLPLEPPDRLVAWMPDLLFNRWFLWACQSGRLLPPLGTGTEIRGLRGSLDYLGLNYYCEETVTLDRRARETLFTRPSPRPHHQLSTYGWPIDPAGLHRALCALWREFGLPILITENGVADQADDLRPAYITRHLRAVVDALEDGVDVRGYLYWSALDNFEWSQGYTQRFGLFAVDPHTMERRPKPSAALFGEICRTRRIPPEP